MKKLTLLLFLLISTSLSAGEVVLKEGPRGLRPVNLSLQKNGSLIMKFDLKSFEMKNATEIPYKNFSQLTFKGLDKATTPGAPELPFKALLLEGHPSDFSFKLVKGKVVSFPDVRVGPAPEMPCRCDKDGEGARFVIDQAAYARKELALLEYVGEYRGRHLSRLLVRPARIENEGLSIYPDLKIEIVSKRGINLIDHKDLQGGGPGYLIVTPERFLASLKPLIDYRTSQGYEIRLVTLEAIGNSFEGIKTYIHRTFINSSFQYALLVGHEDIFPTEYVNTSNDPNTPSDMHYFTFGGETDRIPDVFYGRLVVDTEEEVARQVAKILEYEKRHWKDASGLERMVSIASNEGYNPTDVEYVQAMAHPFEQTFGTAADYFFQENRNSNVGNINGALSRGAMWLNYIGHGSGDSWPSINRNEYTSRDIASISPGVVKPVIIDVACQNGRFSYEGRLGERFMNEVSKEGAPVGAVAYYGGSVDISWHPPAIMAVAINELIVKNGLDNISQALIAGQLKLFEKVDDLESAYENLAWYHLFGDPALRLQLH